MKLIASLLLSMLCLSAAFQAQPRSAKQSVAFLNNQVVGSPTKLYGFLPEPERESLTRESEPEDFFAT